jgi:hypothetical protein
MAAVEAIRRAKRAIHGAIRLFEGWKLLLRGMSSCLPSFACAARRTPQPLVALGRKPFTAAANVRTGPIIEAGFGRIQLVEAAVIAYVENRDINRL